MLICLTGGIGCGKSTVARLLHERGCAVVDVDALVREHVLTDPAVVQMVVERWGPTVRRPESDQLDRAAIARRVFGPDESAQAERTWLESVVHPRVAARWRAAAAQARAVGQRCVVELPLAIEKGLEKEFDFVVTVGASSATQFARLSERGLAPPLAAQRLEAQLPLSAKIAPAHAVIWNDGDLAALTAQVAILVRAWDRAADVVATV
jgi:dephospho-CoA kinase